MKILNHFDNFGSRKQDLAEQRKNIGLAFHHANEVSTGGGVSSSPIENNRGLKIAQSLENIGIKAINTASALNDILGEEASQAILLLCEDLKNWDDEHTRRLAAYALHYIVNRTKPEVLIEVLKDKAPVVMESLIYALSAERFHSNYIITLALREFMNVISIVPKMT